MDGCKYGVYIYILKNKFMKQNVVRIYSIFSAYKNYQVNEIPLFYSSFKRLFVFVSREYIINTRI